MNKKAIRDASIVDLFIDKKGKKEIKSNFSFGEIVDKLKAVQQLLSTLEKDIPKESSQQSLYFLELKSIIEAAIVYANKLYKAY